MREWIGIVVTLSLAIGAAHAEVPAARLAAGLTEIRRLDRRARVEEARSPERPAPARQAIHHLLVELAADGVAFAPSPAERSQLGAGAAVRVRPSWCIVQQDARIQDKAGSYTSSFAALYERRRGVWRRRGQGEIITRP